MEVMETDGKGKIRPLFFFYRIVKKVDFKGENVGGKNSYRCCIRLSGRPGDGGLINYY